MMMLEEVNCECGLWDNDQIIDDDDDDDSGGDHNLVDDSGVDDDDDHECDEGDDGCWDDGQIMVMMMVDTNI